MRAFEAYTWQHGLPIVVFALICVVILRAARGRPEREQVSIGVWMASIVLAVMVGGSLVKLVQGTYLIREDLPLYLCRVTAWTLPFVIWKLNIFWIRIFYFWILAGTLQGIITPDLAEGFPTYAYFRYWCLHAGLVVVILYVICTFRITIRWRDVFLAVFFAQVYLVLVHSINLLLGSNYSYTVRKPPGPSVLDIFGPWPWYILGGEAVMLILFLVLMLPWIRSKRAISAS